MALLLECICSGKRATLVALIHNFRCFWVLLEEVETGLFFCGRLILLIKVELVGGILYFLLDRVCLPHTIINFFHSF